MVTDARNWSIMNSARAGADFENGLALGAPEERWLDNLCIQSVARHILRVGAKRAPSPGESLTSATTLPSTHRPGRTDDWPGTSAKATCAIQLHVVLPIKNLRHGCRRKGTKQIRTRNPISRVRSCGWPLASSNHSAGQTRRSTESFERDGRRGTANHRCSCKLAIAVSP